MTEKEFISRVTKVKGNRVHKVRNSLGVKDAFYFYRKHRPDDSKFVLDASEYLKIIRSVNNIIRDLIINGEEISLPEGMGKLELRKRQTIVEIKNGKLKTNLPIDWNSTLKLWYEDEESYINKKLIRQETKEVFKVYYNKYRANYINKTFYQFHLNREIKKGLKNKIKNNELDALLIYREQDGKGN